MIPPKDQQLKNFLSQEESYRLTRRKSLRGVQRKDRVSFIIIEDSIGLVNVITIKCSSTYIPPVYFNDCTHHKLIKVPCKYIVANICDWKQ
jgi:hypothetical protein